MNAPKNIKALIDSWPRISDFASDFDCGYEAARQMRRRGRVAPEHWNRLVELCNSKNIEGVTLEWLASQLKQEKETA